MKSQLRCALLTCALFTACAKPSSFDEVKIEGSEGILRGYEMPTFGHSLRSTTVILFEPTKEGENICSGTIIAPNLILTAAHCKPGNLNRFYVSFDHTIYPLRKSLVRKVKAFIPHPDYTGEFIIDRDDIALVHFEGSLPEKMEIQKLPEDRAYPFTDGLYWMAGAGISDANGTGMGTLRYQVHLPKRKTSWKDGIIMFDQTVVETIQEGICSGDSGGPLYAYSKHWKDTFVLIGVTSFSFNATARCANAGFVAIRPHLPWLKKVIRQYNPID